MMLHNPCQGKLGMDMFLMELLVNFVSHHVSFHQSPNIKEQTIAGWWFQPIPKILVKLEIFPK